METLLELAKIVLPAAIVLYAMYLVIRSLVARDIELRKLEVRTRSIETVLPARLQAYERMCLFLERISPQSLLIRLNNPGLSAREFQRLLLDEIRNEYNHNVSQQVYMSETVWNLIRNSKEGLVMVINEAASTLPPEATALDLSRKIFELNIDKSIDPIGHTLSEVKKEIQQTF
ncbi:MAG: hypothetical protein K1X47_02310 [Cyclobacteriaceae bacterium]|nr:hypothetical protein [Cyclobacteriaceae bacterium]